MPYFNAGEVELYYERTGEGEPLLLIHGLGSSSRDWELQVPDFAGHFQVICVDLRGHGRSSKPSGPYSMEVFAGDVSRLLEGLGTGPAHAVGISLGGMVAFQLALDHPRQVRKLVIVNSVAELVPHNLADRLGFWQRLLIVRLLGMEKMGQVLAERFLPKPDQEALREVFIRRWAENHVPSYLASLKAAYGWSVIGRLGEIRSHTLVLGSDGDYFPTSQKEAYTALIPNATLTVIKNSRHALPAEKPAEFNRIVLDFLTASPGDDPG